MKIYVLILNIVITGATLYGSSTESPMAEIRNLILQGHPNQSTKAFLASNHELINTPDAFVKAVQYLIEPLVDNESIYDNPMESTVEFLLTLIVALKDRYPKSSAEINHQLANFNFNSFAVQKVIRATPILYITLIIKPEHIAVLLDAGANPNAVDPLHNKTPLMRAASLNMLPEVQLLLKHGANPLLKDNNGKTARALALTNEHFEIAQLLQDAEVKAALDAPDKGDFNQEQHS